MTRSERNIRILSFESGGSTMRPDRFQGCAGVRSFAVAYCGARDDLSLVYPGTILWG